MVNNLKDKLINLSQELSEYRLLIQRGFLIMAIFILALDFLLKLKLWPLALLFGVCNVASFYLTKGEIVDDGKALKQYHAFLYGSALYLSDIASSLLLSSEFGPLLCVMITIVVLALAYAKFSKHALDDQTWNLLWNSLSRPWYKTEEDMVDPFDTILGTVAETGKPNIIPYKDRFVHFLIIGATGTGKTSQSLIPMSFRDIENPDIGVVCLEPKGDFAEQIYAYAKICNRQNVVYFNPILENCPYYNPLKGELNDVIENITTAFSSLDTDSKAYFQNMNRSLLVNGITVVKALYGDDATLVHLNTLLTNYKEAFSMVSKYEKLPLRTSIEKEHRSEIVNWFLNDYFTGMAGASKQGGGVKVMATKTYENSSGIRMQLANLISNDYLRRVLNPPRTSTLNPDEYIDFDRVLANGEVLCMCSADGVLRDLGKTLGMFLIQSFEASVFKRPGNEHTRKGCIFYVDEFQKYANKGYDDLLTLGRSYRVSSVLATQSVDGIAVNSGSSGKTLTNIVTSNCRNKVIYPGCSAEDAKYFSKLFGTKKVHKESLSVSRGRNLWDKYNIAEQRETFKEEDVEVPVFSESEIIYQKKMHAITKLVIDNVEQRATDVEMHFIDGKIYKAVGEYVKNNISPHMMNGDEYKARKKELEASYELEENKGYDTDDEAQALPIGGPIDDSGNFGGSDTLPIGDIERDCEDDDS